jgi:hypothetical protein
MTMDNAVTSVATTPKSPAKSRTARRKKTAKAASGKKAVKPAAKKTAARAKKTYSKEDLFARNMALFARINPPFHAKLAGMTETHSQLVFDDDGDPDIEFRGTRLYGMGARCHAEKQVADFWQANPARLQFIPPQSSTLDQVAGDFTYRMMRRAVDAKIEFVRNPSTIHSYFLIIYGVGLGQHIEQLTEDTDCKGLVLVEPNDEFLYHSLSVFDWAGLFERFEKDDDTYIMLSTGSDYKRIHTDIRSFVRGTCPSFFDGTVIYHHYPNSVMEMAQQDMQKDANLFLSGLGFLEDELLMVSNSHANMKKYDSHIYKHPQTMRSLPAFIIGSGPSLDGCLDVIRDNMDRALVISCGTALGVLLANGIVPDFHMEMENVELVHEILLDKTTTYDLSNTCLVASSTVDPRITDLFEKKVIFFRQVLASWEIFSLGADTGLHEVGPTVTNCGLAFAQEIGYREFYFFGMDYGTRHKDRHHAKGSIYEPGGKAEYTDDFPKQRAGNFGGTIHTHGVFGWARAVVEICIRRFRSGRTYYNCSDGVAIDGAVPRAAKTLSLPAGVDKAKEIETLLGQFPKYSRAQFDASWTQRDWAGAVDELCDTLIDLCDIEDEDYPLRYMAAVARTLIPKTVAANAPILMIRGSILMVLISAAYYLSRLADRGRRAELEAIVRDEFIATLEAMKQEAGDGLRALDG